MNRATNQGLLDANSQLPLSYVYTPLITTNTATAAGVGSGILHGFLISTSGLTTNKIIAYDTIITTTAAGLVPLVTTSIVGVCNTSTTNPGFVYAGDVVFNTGLVILTTQGTAGVVQAIYL